MFDSQKTPNVSSDIDFIDTENEFSNKFNGENGFAPDARNGKIDDAFLLNFYAGYDFMENYRFTAGVNNATDLEYIASRHPNGARRGAPLTAYFKAAAKF